MKKGYDSSWDPRRSEKGNLPDNDEAYEQKYGEWVKRHWMDWLAKHLSFPFTATREEDENDAYFQEGAAAISPASLTPP